MYLRDLFFFAMYLKSFPLFFSEKPLIYFRIISDSVEDTEDRGLNVFYANTHWNYVILTSTY